MFGRRIPVYVAFDVLVVDGHDLRFQPLSSRKAALAKLARRARGWIAIVDEASGQGRRLSELVVAQDLEGIVAKRLDDPYGPDVTWFVQPKRRPARTLRASGQRTPRRSLS
jgi:bifunctional non-homologous end joining protein LigD